MKLLFSISCLFTVTIGLSFYLYPRMPAISEATQETLRPIEKNASRPLATETTQVQPAEKLSTTDEKKDCACCLSTLAKIKERRKALEMWAREMIAIHGYEEGMKRVNAKSPTLAKRVQSLLEKEKNARGIPTQMVR